MPFSLKKPAISLKKSNDNRGPSRTPQKSANQPFDKVTDASMINISVQEQIKIILTLLNI